VVWQLAISTPHQIPAAAAAPPYNHNHVGIKLICMPSWAELCDGAMTKPLEFPPASVYASGAVFVPPDSPVIMIATHPDFIRCVRYR
jgi:hypothetical protein